MSLTPSVDFPHRDLSTERFLQPRLKFNAFVAQAHPLPVPLVDGQHVECVATSSAASWQHTGTLLVDADPDLLRRIGIASSSMNSLSQVWPRPICRPGKSSVSTILVSCPSFFTRSMTWTLLSADTSSLERFHMRCQRRIPGHQMAGQSS